MSGIPRALRVRNAALEEQVSDLRVEIARWQRAYTALKDVLVAASGSQPDIDAVDEAVRVWAALGGAELSKARPSATTAGLGESRDFGEEAPF